MDYHTQNVPWQWQGDDLLQKNVNFDSSKRGCNDISITQNEPDIPNIFGGNTPVKACGEVLFNFNECDIMTKTPQDSEELPPSKRRRMLDFDDVNEDILSSSLKSKEQIDNIDEFLSEISLWESCLQEDLSPSDFEALSQSEAWLADCLNVNNTSVNSNDGIEYIATDVQMGKTEVCNNNLGSATKMNQRPLRSSRNVIFKGRKGYMSASPKPGSSIVYPFEYIKPSWVRGDVTLKDINYRIRTPPPSKPKQVEEDHLISAFSGKQVVGKTRIPTQGGRGSITIMRTKG